MTEQTLGTSHMTMFLRQWTKKKKKIRRENVEDTITQTGNIKGMEMPLKKIEQDHYIPKIS